MADSYNPNDAVRLKHLELIVESINALLTSIKNVSGVEAFRAVSIDFENKKLDFFYSPDMTLPDYSLDISRLLFSAEASETYITKSSAIAGLEISDTTLIITYGDGATDTAILQDTTYSNATVTKAGLMSASDKAKLNGISPNATAVNVDTNISANSTNPVQNKAVKNYVDTAISDLVDGAPEQMNTLSKLADMLRDGDDTYATLLNLIGLKVDSEIGKGLSENDFTNAYKEKLDGIENNANNFILGAATNDSLGGVMIGKNLTNENGKISITDENIIAALGYTPPREDTNTHYQTKLIVGAGDSTVNSATTNGNTYIRLFDDNTARDSIQISGAGNTTVTSGDNGNIIIESRGGGGSGGSADISECVTNILINGTSVIVTYGDGSTQTFQTQDTTYLNATTEDAGLMSANDKQKLNGIAVGATKITVDDTISESSTNPVQNKVVKKYVDQKVTDLVNGAPETMDTLKEISDAIKNNSDIAAALTDAIGNKVDKVSGKDLSSNDFTDDYKEKLDGLTTALNQKANVSEMENYVRTIEASNNIITAKNGKGDTVYTGINSGGGGFTPIIRVTTESDTVITVTNGDIGLVSTGENGEWEFSVPYFGEWIITAVNPKAKAVTMSVDVKAVQVYEIAIKTIFRYGYRIVQGESDPYARVEYLYDAVGMTPAKMDFTKGVFDYGDWKDVWFMTENKPLMLKSDGTVGYYLNPDDYSKKEDGTDSDIANEEYDGNGMSQIPLCWVKRYMVGEDAYEIISNVKYDDDYKAYAHTDASGRIKDYFYWGLFKGSGNATKIRSLSGKNLSHSLTAAQEVAGCVANGDGWYTRTWSQYSLLRNLITLIGKSTNSQAVFGNGNSGILNQSGENLLPTGTLKDKGQFYGANANNQRVKAFHVEDIWGNQWERVAGLINDHGKIYVKMTPEGDGYRIDNVNGYTDTGLMIFAATYAFIKALNCSEYGCIPTAVGGSGSTYYCDGCWGSINNLTALLALGCSNTGVINGIWAFSLYDTVSLAATYCGCSLSYV